MELSVVTMDRFIAFDVETPNSYNHRMSSIGIAVIEQGRIVDSFSSLIDPETHFDAFNISLTGISPEMVEHAPTFPELWAEIGGLMKSGILVAHNAAFDMRVLSRCLMHYEIDVRRYAKYICTVTMGRSCFPSLPNHKLNTLCSCRGIPLDHHRADSDSLACASLLLDYIQQGSRPEHFVRIYDLWNGFTLKRRDLMGD